MKQFLDECQEVFDKGFWRLTTTCCNKDKYVWETVVRTIKWPLFMDTFLISACYADSISDIDVTINRDATEPDKKAWLKFKIELKGFYDCSIDYEYRISRENLKKLCYEIEHWLEVTDEE